MLAHYRSSPENLNWMGLWPGHVKELKYTIRSTSGPNPVGTTLSHTEISFLVLTSSLLHTALSTQTICCPGTTRTRPPPAESPSPLPPPHCTQIRPRGWTLATGAEIIGLMTRRKKLFIQIFNIIIHNSQQHRFPPMSVL